MKKIWAICSFELKKIFIKPQSYVLMFGMPLLFTLIFGGLIGDSPTAKITIGYVDEDHSVISKSFHDSLLNNQLFQLKKMTRNEAVQQVKDNQLAGFLQISKGFQNQFVTGGQPKILFEHSPDYRDNAMVDQIVSNAAAKVSIQTKASTVWSSFSHKQWSEIYPKVDNKSTNSDKTIQKVVMTANPSNQEMGNMASRSAGFSIMFVMISMMSVTGVLLEARKMGVWSRLLSTPTAKFEIISGYFLAFFFIGWIQFGILMAATSLLFGVHWGNFLGIMVLVSALLLCVVGLGLFIAGFVKTAEQQSMLGSVVITATCMLGGVFWPLAIVPAFMQKIADFVPQTWAMKGFTELIARGGTILDITAPVCVLLAFSATFLIVGLTRIRYE